MKTTILHLTFVLGIFVPFHLIAQEQVDSKNSENENTGINSSHSEIFSTSPVAEFKFQVEKEINWDVAFLYHGISHENDFSKSKKDSLKHQKTIQKFTSNAEAMTQDNLHFNDLPTSAQGGSPNNPIVELDFQGNGNNGFTPPDNNIAVSDDGYVVSVVNSSISMYDNNGNIIDGSSLGSFFNVLNLSGSYFDPKIVYDPSEDKFVLVVLNGNTAANSTIAVAFSTTGNPSDSWWFYTISGNPLDDNSWFDFPSIGISTDELYISGNLFDANNEFNQTIIYQINKENAFAGGDINWIYWNDIRDSNGNRDFTVVPASHGFDETTGPGISFVSSDSFGGSEVMLYWTTETIENEPSLLVASVSVPSYEIGGNGLQLGSSDFMSTNDTRIQSAFYADETVFFVMNTDAGSGYTGIYYGRIDVPNLVGTSNTFGLDEFDYAFPSIAAFSTSEADKTVLIGFMRTGASIYPEFRTVSCDENWNWSSSVLVRSGDSFVDFLEDDIERWGDYSGICKRHLNDGVEVWISGCYGENQDGFLNNVLGTWIGKISRDTSPQIPITDFSANQTIITQGQQIVFTDLSVNNPTNWIWSFPGGTPSSSSLQNPTVTYNAIGTYDVSLTSSNISGEDLETKTGYVTVNVNSPAPVANFTADQTIIAAGEQINFTDLSGNNPTNWVWSFPGGSPTTSASQNPSVSYLTPGTYDVTLVASNAGGNDAEIKTGYVIVNPGQQPPVANFEANTTSISAGGIVEFTDLSSNNPTNWVWSFPGGTPATSNLQNPIIVYSTSGVYDVSLVSSNAAGSASTTIENYITVDGVNSIEEVSSSIDDFKIFPNPSVPEGRITAQFGIQEAMELDFYIADDRGRIIKHLMHHRAKQGSNSVSFNAEMLSAGVYHLIIQNQYKQIIRNGKIIIG